MGNHTSGVVTDSISAKLKKFPVDHRTERQHRFFGYSCAALLIAPHHYSLLCVLLATDDHHSSLSVVLFFLSVVSFLYIRRYRLTLQQQQAGDAVAAVNTSHTCSCLLHTHHVLIALFPVPQLPLFTPPVCLLSISLFLCHSFSLFSRGVDGLLILAVPS